MFPITSRYYGIETTTLGGDEAEGRSVAYLRRRFIPPPEQFALLQEHTVTRGDRLDNLADQYIGDPELFWRICDANNAMRPEDLTASDRIGSKLRITLPQGIPGMETPNA